MSKKNNSLFRVTPFNGYDQKDVLAYIVELDEKIKFTEETNKQKINDFLAELTAAEKRNLAFEEQNNFLTEQINEYKVVAEQIEEYKNEIIKLSAINKENEILLHNSNNDDLQKKLTSTIDELNFANEKINQINYDFNVLNSRYNELFENNKMKISEIETLNQQIEADKFLIEKFDNTIINNSINESDFNKIISEKDALLLNNMSMFEEKNNEINDLKQINENLRMQVKEIFSANNEMLLNRQNNENSTNYEKVINDYELKIENLEKINYENEEKILELSIILENLDENSKYNEKIAELNEKINELNKRNIENELEIQNLTKIKTNNLNNETASSKEREFYLQVKENVESIINKAKLKADDIIFQAGEEAKNIVKTTKNEKNQIDDRSEDDVQRVLNNAIEESAKIISAAKERSEKIMIATRESTILIKDKLLKIKTAVNGLISTVDYAAINVDLDKILSATYDDANINVSDKYIKTLLTDE